MDRKFLLQIDRDDYTAITLIADVANARIHACIVIRSHAQRMGHHHIHHQRLLLAQLTIPKRDVVLVSVMSNCTGQPSELNERIRLETSTSTRLRIEH